MLEISNISAGYRKKGEYSEVLRKLNLKLPNNEIVGIIGESGSGKTTLLRTIAGELYRSSGDILYNGKSIFGIDSFRAFRKRRIYVRQESLNILKPRYSVEFQVKKLFKGGKYEVDSVYHAFKYLNLPDDTMSMLPSQLSDGTRHRVVLAMAAILKPEILLLDEPTTGFDSTAINGLLLLLKEIRSSTSIIIVSSDVVPVFEVCNRIYVMKKGTIIEDGYWEDILKNPHHPFTRDLVKYVPSLKNRSLRYENVDSGEGEGCVFIRNCLHRKDACRAEIPYERDNDHGYACIRYPEWINDPVERNLQIL